MEIQTINPATEEPLKTYHFLDTKEMEEKIETTHHTYLTWKKTSFAERSSLMLALANTLTQQKRELALLITQEMGKPIVFAEAEIDKCITLCKHYATHAEQYLSSRTMSLDNKKALICYRPLGIVFGIMPWNFPFWQVLRFAVPTIMAGNAALLKHAPITAGSGEAIEQLFVQAGFPKQLFQHMIVDNAGAAKIIAHPAIAAVTLTGSERAGRSVAAQAGAYLKKVVLELGGSDPYLVLADADLDLAARSIVNSRLNNTGQVCIAAKRIIVVQEIENKLIDKIQNYMTTFVVGNPLEKTTQLGPMARQDLREVVHKQVDKSVKLGAKLLAGGIIPESKGYYYPPTLLTNVYPGMPAFDEELFGPVIAVTSVKSEQDAVLYANKTQYGLGAAVFTRDIAHGKHIAIEELEAGSCFVNNYVTSDPRLPFGGVKNSGYGRELSQEGIHEFVNIKTIVISD